MISAEFKTQVFRTPAQWQSGLLSGLESLPTGGVTLFSHPTFVEWLQANDRAKSSASLVIDECRQVYWIDKATCHLYRFDPKTENVERIRCLSGCGANPSEVRDPGRMMMDRFNLWILDKDKDNHRVQAFSREHFQLKYLIEALAEPIDFGLDDASRLYVLDKSTRQIHPYAAHGLPSGEPFGSKQLKKPVGLTIGKGGRVYVIDQENKHFLQYDPNGVYLGEIGDFGKISPALIASNKKGNLFVVDGAAGQLHEFDADGSHLGAIKMPSPVKTIEGIAFDPQDNLYLSTDRGIAFFSAQMSFVGKPGEYYTRTLDQGSDKSQWHRLALKVDAPPGTIVEVSYYSDDNASLKDLVDKTITAPDESVQKKKERLDALLGPKWIAPPEKNPEDMFFRNNTGRYLWLKLALSTFDEKQKPKVTEMRVYYPRLSYLRYLPATYQEDVVHRVFLERFLSMFESVLHGLETEIATLFRRFDPETTPPEFLDWLASWLNLALEEDWPEERKRQFILQAATLFKQKGTAAGITTLVEIYTGKRPLIVEHAMTEQPLILLSQQLNTAGKRAPMREFRVGLNTVVSRAPVRGFRLGEDAILGRTAIREVVQLPEEPFLQFAHRFTILLSLNRQEFKKYEGKLWRILAEETPAHTAYSLRLIGDTSTSPDIFVGINSNVAEHQPFRLGVESIVGMNVAAILGEKAVWLERNSKIDRGIKLI